MEEEPFPWQKALFQNFIAGDIPENLDVATGLGKTSALRIWLGARALGAAVPRRLVYIVDRRAVVDQASSEAMRLRQLLATAPDPLVQAIRRRLELEGERLLAVSTLRGQHPDNRLWLTDPARPAIVVGTVDMIGSRLLFEGYGVSRRMRPFHAGLLGQDCLFVLDEAHLVPPFEALLQQIAKGGPHLRPPRSLPPLRLLSLSATRRISATGAFSVVGCEGALDSGAQGSATVAGFWEVALCLRRWVHRHSPRAATLAP